MTTAPSFTHDPDLDLRLERLVDVPVELVWRAWTEPEHVMAWFTPRPWQTVACEIHLRPGGRFATVMRDPEGNEFPSEGCYLEVEAPTRLVFTSALLPGYRPLPDDAAGLAFTAVLTFEPVGGSTRYSARAIHGSRDGAEEHRQMGFLDGWGAALDQLVEHMTGPVSGG
jgi:uncharacterized protein YndB with AHSA1/START domain